MSDTNLKRSETDRILAGVCGGIAAYLDIDSVFVRLLFLFLILASGIGLPLYIILWIVMPRETASQTAGKAVYQDNLDEMGHTVTEGVNKIGKPATVGLVLIFIGAYFLLGQAGWLGWLGNGVFLSLAIIGVGAYMLNKSRQ